MNVVVIGHPRSGTNSLVEVLQLHGLSMANEPFNEEYATWGTANVDYVARLGRGEAFDALVDEVLTAFDGLKELSYQLGGDHLERVVRRPGVRVVTLRRRNVLQTAISQIVAEQTGLWKTWDADGPLEDHYRDLGPLDLDLLWGRMCWTVDEVARVEAAVSGLDHLALTYEDVYLSPPDVQSEQLAALRRFLDLPVVDTPAVRHFLSAAVRQSRPSTYGRIPNLAHIEATLGDDATGHLDL